MSRLRARLHHFFAGVFALGLLGLGATDAHATHFRYGTLRWELAASQPSDPLQVRIKVTAESAWRRSFAWPSGQIPTVGVPLNTSYSIQVQSINTLANLGTAPLTVIPSSVNITEDWFVGGTIAEFQFQRAQLPVRIFWASNARVSNLRDGNNDRPFRVEAVMSATPNAASPSASILPIITVPYPAPGAQFFIPATDVEGDTLTWSIAPAPRSQLNKIAPDGLQDNFAYTLSINPATGEVKWRTELEVAPAPGGDYFAVQFLVTDSKGAETPVDALLRLIPAVGTAPQVLINGSPNAFSADVRPNNPVTFTVTGTDADAGAFVTLTSGALPPGSVMTPSLPTAGAPPRTSTFTWTPTLAQAGNTYPISFGVTDDFGMQDTNSASIRVLANFPPVFAFCPATITMEATSPAGATATLQASVSDPDGDALTAVWRVNGVAVETDTVPAGAGATLITLTRNFGFLPAPHSIAIELSDGLVTTVCVGSLLIRDTTGPVVTVTDSGAEATGPTGAIVNFVATAVDLVDGVITPVSCTPASGSLFPLGATTVTCTAQDTRGNIGTGTGVMTVVDTTDPVVTVPSLTREATGPSGAVITFTATATDTVSGVLTPTCTPASGSTFPLGATVVTCTATDGAGNVGTGTGTMTVVDTTGPVVVVTPTTAEATGPDGAIVNFVAVATDAVDGNVTPVNCTPASGTLFPLGPTTVTCTAVDSRGNTGTGTGVMTVVDTTGPAVTVPSTTAEATGSSGAVVTFVATAVDLVDGPVTPVNCTPASGSTFPLGATNVVCTAVDSRGNPGQGTGVVTVVDTTPPVVTVQSRTVEATGPAGAVVMFTATAMDLVDGSLTPTCTPASGSTFPLGATTVTCTAVDSRGNTGTGTGTITVVDTEGPVVSVPNTTAEATGPTGAVVTFTATATDVVDGVVPVTCTPASGSLFPLGATTVTCTATDSEGNVGTGTGVVTVVDTTGPTVTVPSSSTEATGPAGAVVTFVATAVDLVDGVVTPVTCTPASGSTFPVGETTVTCTASDSRGNVGTGTGTVTVTDTTPPVVTVPSSTTEATGPAGAAVSFTATAVDLVDGNLTPTCVPASGSTFPLAATTVTCTAVDSHGNTGTGTGVVTVVDTTPPVISNMPADITVTATSPSGAVVTWPSPTAMDIVDLSVPVTCVPASGTVFRIGNTLVTCSASDTRGNSSSASFTVTVINAAPPVVNVSLNPGLLWPPNHKMVNITVTVTGEGQNCSIHNVTSNQPQNGTGDGDTDIDWIFSGMNLQLRAERAGNDRRGVGRIYTVTVVCYSASGVPGYGTATAIVPHDMRTPR